MTTTSLPDRLRALADFIDANNLPEPILTLVTGDYGTANLVSHHDLCAWAEVLGAEVQVQRFEKPDRVYDYYTFGDAVRVGQQRLHFAYSQDVAEVPA